MAWSCKPSGGYYLTSTEGINNIWQMYYWMLDYGYTLEAMSGVIANCYHESALNPWRWQSDSVSYSAGYGLFQFTPARDYLNGCSWVTGYAPNYSTSSVSGGNQSDGEAQMYVMLEDVLSKWVGTLYRSYWVPGQGGFDQGVYDRCQYVINTYGNGYSVTQAQFANITSVEDALCAFFAGYEGPWDPTDYYGRVQTAYDVYQILGGTPPPPSGGLPIWLLFKLRDNNYNSRKGGR